MWAKKGHPQITVTEPLTVSFTIDYQKRGGIVSGIPTNAPVTGRRPFPPDDALRPPVLRSGALRRRGNCPPRR